MKKFGEYMYVYKIITSAWSGNDIMENLDILHAWQTYIETQLSRPTKK